MKFRLSRLAQADLRDIGEHTLERWGLARRRAYLRAIDARFAALARRPRLGRAREEVGPNLRSANIGSHVIFYRAADEGIEVLRILHGRMDAERHVAPDDEGAW